MSATVIRRTNCRLCASKNLDLALHLEPTPLADSYVPASELGKVQEIYPLDVHLCRDCGFSQLNDVVQPQVIYFDYLYETKTSLGLVDHFRRYAAETVERLKPAKGSLAVDIGSNDGTLIGFFRDHGLKVLGVDPAREIAKRATAAGLETWPELFDAKLADRIRAEKGAASIVTVNNLFANVDDLVGMTEGIRRLLAPDGVFSFESFYLVDLMENMVFDFIYHEHISLFSVKPLQKFFASRGLELIDAQRVPTKGGSLRYSVQLAGGPRKPSPAVADLIRLENERGVQSLAAFKAFDVRINEASAAVAKALEPYRGKKGAVAGYGASATTTTMLYHFGLLDSISFIADDNPQRQNLFSPGRHIPILPPASIEERKPEAVVIFAWRYADPIRKNLKSYTDKGGKLIIPLPAVKVV